MAFFSLPTAKASNIHDSLKDASKAVFIDPIGERTNLWHMYLTNKDVLPDSTIALIFSQIGISHAVQSSYDSALHYFYAAAALVPHNSPPYFRYQNNIAISYRSSGKLKEALAMYYDMLPNVQVIDPDFISYIYSGMASVLRMMNLKNEALEYLLKNIKRLETSESTGELDLNIEYQKLANIYFDLERYDDAIELYLKILPSFVENDRLDVYYISLANLADSYSYNEDYARADSLLRMALDGAIKLGQKSQIALIHQKLSAVFFEQEMYKESLHHAEIGFKQISSFDALFYGNNLTSYLQSLMANEMYDKALTILREHESNVSSIDESVNVAFFNVKANLLKRMGYYEEAFEVMSQVNDANIRIQKNTRDFALFNALEKHKNDLLAQENLVLEKEVEIQYRRQLAFLILLGLLLTIIVYQYVLRIFKKRASEARKKLEREREERAKFELEQLKQRETLNKQVIEQQRNDLLDAAARNISINKQVNEVLDSIDAKKPITTIRKQITDITKEDAYWKTVVKRLQANDSNFFNRLKSTYPELTKGDLELCALIRLGLSYKEIGELLNISHESVYTKKYRLTKKIQIDESVDFHKWIMAF